MDIFSPTINLTGREQTVLRHLRKEHGWIGVARLSIELNGEQGLTMVPLSRTARGLVREGLAEHRIHEGRTEYQISPDGALVIDRYEPGRSLADYRPAEPTLRERVAQARADHYEQAIGHGEKTGHEVQEAEAYGRVRAYDDVLAMIDGRA